MGVVPVISVGVDLGLRHEKDADEFVESVLEDASGDVVASTHLVAGPVHRHVAVAFSGGDELEGLLGAALEGRRDWALVAGDRVQGVPELQPGARAAVVEHEGRTGGRLVRFAGFADLVGEVTVEQILASAIERVAVLADEDPPARTRVVTRDFVRPRWSGGRLVLHTQPNRGGTLVPFETPDPTPCCQDHR